MATMTGDDIDGDALTYAIIGGNEAGHFSINVTSGTVRVAGPIDYETNNTHELAVEVSDGLLQTQQRSLLTSWASMKRPP